MGFRHRGNMCMWGGRLLTSTIVFLISALGNIFLRTVDPPCGAFWGRNARACVCVCIQYVCVSACARVSTYACAQI